MSTAKILLPCRVCVECNCKQAFTATLDDGVDFVRCPHCGDVAYLDVEVVEHWTDYSERPHEYMIAQGEAGR